MRKGKMGTIWAQAVKTLNRINQLATARGYRIPWAIEPRLGVFMTLETISKNS